MRLPSRRPILAGRDVHQPGNVASGRNPMRGQEAAREDVGERYRLVRPPLVKMAVHANGQIHDIRGRVGLIELDLAGKDRLKPPDKFVLGQLRHEPLIRSGTSEKTHAASRLPCATDKAHGVTSARVALGAWG